MVKLSYEYSLSEIAFQCPFFYGRFLSETFNFKDPNAIKCPAKEKHVCNLYPKHGISSISIYFLQRKLKGF